MKSMIIGISRPGDADGVSLAPSNAYVARCGSFPEVSFSIKCKQLEFYEKVKELRYTDGDPTSSDDAIDFFQHLTREIFDNLKYLDNVEKGKSSLHIRLITTPMELAQLPFEFVPGKAEGSLPLLADPDRAITLTREVLQVSEARYVWPKQPRILYAWSEPTASVPHEKHQRALIDSLKTVLLPKKNIPIPEPDIEPFLTELPNATLSSISQAMTKGIKDRRPYSHIHILAHGGHITDFSGIQFRLILNADEKDLAQSEKVNGEGLVGAIIPVKNGPVPVFVTLSACDSGGTGSTLVPSGSLVYQLHNAGIPCVFASQFPLTQEGSVTLVNALYDDLINAKDPREVLRNARLELRKNNSHDWASLLAYARFPEDIEEQLEDIRLKMLFSSMKVTAKWTDHVLKYMGEIPEDKRKDIFTDIENRLNKSISELSAYLTPECESTLSSDVLKSEHMGLLGSAYKRRAEFLYRIISFYPEMKDEYFLRSMQSLSDARDFYYRGYDQDASNHWVAMQYLSLKAILGETLEADKEMWNYILFIAKQKEQKAEKGKEDDKKIWAWGTLAELYLIRPFTVKENEFQTERKKAVDLASLYLKKIAGMGKDDIENPGKFNDAKEATARQLERYIYWWPEMFPVANNLALKEMALPIRAELPSLEELSI
jgi:hypothetical protein